MLYAQQGVQNTKNSSPQVKFAKISKRGVKSINRTHVRNLFLKWAVTYHIVWDWWIIVISNTQRHGGIENFYI